MIYGLMLVLNTVVDDYAVVVHVFFLKKNHHDVLHLVLVCFLFLMVRCFVWCVDCLCSFFVVVAMMLFVPTYMCVCFVFVSVFVNHDIAVLSLVVMM